MVKRTFLLGVTLLAATGISGAFAQPDSYCATYEGQMAPDTLYLATACPGNTNARCLVPVVPSTTIRKAVTYRFLYKTPRTSIQNSLIVIQLKGVAAQAVPAPVSVKLTRQQLSFACHTKSWTYVQGPIPDDVDNVSAAPDVAYDVYDQFHRYGFAPRKELKVLLKFHTSYFNGSACVSTLEKVRRAQFLFTDRANVADILVSLWTRFGFGTPTAVAAEINRYDHLQVVLANYKKQPQASGCVSFVAQSNGPSLEINLSDLEEKAQTANNQERFTPKLWIVNTK